MITEHLFKAQVEILPNQDVSDPAPVETNYRRAPHFEEPRPCFVLFIEGVDPVLTRHTDVTSDGSQVD